MTNSTEKKIYITTSVEHTVLFAAINHFISIADIIASGVFLEDPNGRISIFVPVNKNMPRDGLDFACFQARFRHIEPELIQRGINVRLERYNPDKPIEPFQTYLLDVPNEREQLLTLAGVLARSSDPLGWGSQKPLVDKFFRLGFTHAVVFAEALNLAGPERRGSISNN